MILNEKLFLNEKFGDMPNWLKGNLIYKERRHKPAYPGSANRRNFKSYNIGNDVNYNNESDNTDLFKPPASSTERIVKPKYAYRDMGSNSIENADTSYTYRYRKNNDVVYSGNDKNSGLFNQLLNYGLDPSKLNVIEEPLPTSVRDKHLKDPFLPVFLLIKTYDTGNEIQQVYIKGINDEEIDKIINPYEDKPLKRLPMKDLINPQYCKKFAYIDTTDKNNWLDQDKIKERDKYFKELNVNKYLSTHYSKDKDYIRRDNTNKIKDIGKPNYNDTRYDLYKLKYDKGMDLANKVEQSYQEVSAKLKDLLKYISWTDTDIDLPHVVNIPAIIEVLKHIRYSLDESDPSKYTNPIEKGYNNTPLVADRNSRNKRRLNNALNDLKGLDKMIDNITDEISDEEELAELDWE